MIAPVTMLSATAAPLVANAADEASTVQEVIVTGSRISGITNAQSASPITTASKELIDETKSTLIEDVLARMIGPDFNSTSIGTNNGGDGNSTVSLRNLGSTRTLVLIDGTRLIPNGGAVDLNTIPLGMVERIDVLRDGASSVYGADAIGGVVNIITKKHADGMTADLEVGQSGHGDGLTYALGSTVGVNSDKGNVLISVNWDHRDAINGSDRSWATDPHIGTSAQGGSAYRSQLDLLQDEYSSNVWANGVLYSKHNPALAGLAPGLVFLPSGTSGTVKMDANAPGWNTLTGEMDRKQISFNTHYDITSDLTFIAEGFYSDRVSEQRLRPEPLLGDTIATYNANGTVQFAGLIIPANAPGNTTGQAITAYLTPVQFGPRIYDQNSQTARIHVGFAGTLLKNYKWEVGAVDQENTEDLAIKNSGNWNHIAQITGQIPCTDVPGGCSNGLPNVQPNWFNGPNNIFTPAQLAYVKYTRHDTQYANERYAFANIGGPIWTLPAGDLKFSVGAEHREEHLEYTPDQLTTEGWTANASQPTAGSYQVTSAYAEFFVPVLKDAFLAKNLDVNISGRHDSYNLFGDADTYKIGVNWQITDEVRFRGAWSTGFRAPQISELFGGQTVSDNGASGDPCETNLALKAGGNANVGTGVLAAGSTCSKAVAHGAAVTSFTDPLDQIGGSQLQTLTGGSTQLKPEQAHQITAGVVLTPKFAPGLSFSTDYYRIFVSHAILDGGIAGATSNDFILNGCYGPQQNQSFCADVVRNASGVITQINSLNTNAGYQVVSGVDLDLAYNTRKAGLNLPIPGYLLADLQLSKTIQDYQINIDGSVSNYVSFFDANNETIVPTWRGVLNLDYHVGDFIVHWDTRYTEAMDSFAGGTKGYGNYIPNVYYSAASVTYHLTHFGALNHSKITVGIDNLFDKNPPFINSDSTCKCNTLAGPFDVVGRYFYSRLSASF